MPDRKQAKGGEHDIGRNSPKRTKTFSPGHPMLDPLPDPNPVKSPQGSPNLSGDNLVRPKTLRILIIGRANSGKTTILQKICQSDKPVVRRIMRGTYHTYMHDKGINVKQYWGVLNDDNPSPISPSRERGIHDIWNEISCPSSPGFIFHDSFGVEAGASDEWEVIQHFIKTRASSSSLEERLHAIWFCLPTDTDRPLLNVERNFFSVDTFGVPVIAVFTKFDAQHVKAYEGLRNQGITRKQAWMQARSVAYKFLHDYLEVEVMKLPHPPASCVCLESM